MITQIQAHVRAESYHEPEELTVEYDRDTDVYFVIYSGLQARGQGGEMFHIFPPTTKKIFQQELDEPFFSKDTLEKVRELIGSYETTGLEEARDLPRFSLRIREENDDDCSYQYYTSDDSSLVAKIISRVSSAVLDHDMVQTARTRDD
ncbi:MAG: hypothetical protein ACLFR1_10750 [Spirochaetia bacterium]